MLYHETICATELGIQKKLLHSVAVGLAAMSTLTTRNAGDSFGWLSGAMVSFRTHNPEVPGSNPGIREGHNFFTSATSIDFGTGILS